ncbi:uncharacterized protein MELLADRAFT_84617 [Melampsora larici-populina 98AG31]|uniref:DNA-directed RNA polymerase III subunit RPC3 n=1 Tax=Melampsora larici-populina (strain 98AG31 / pathotype 3-4-7) TaxID=747676 RepID=F4RGB9_MELLP|nr:uncharacterized protein MELLADRAFT_84617 [Melampsora larici-populina 98AG31]EGG08446.1 hypothetical protein MELLADRAFT_84617 [Melampsora larici-populina 98AG31]
MIGPQDITLCEHLLTTLYGHACGEIGSLLLRRGRLPFSSLVKLSSLTSHSIRSALITLIQQNCVCHSETSSASTSTQTNSPEYFEVIPNEILARIRFGKYITIVDELFGIESSSIIEFVLENGKIRIGQLIASLLSNSNSNSMKSDSDSHEVKSESLKKSQIIRSNILNLLSERFLKPSQPSHSIASLDLELAWEKQMISEIPGIPTPKDLRAVKERVVDKVVVERDREFDELCAFDLKKRKMTIDAGGRGGKRSKIEESILDDDMFVRVNYDRFDIKIRNSIFEQECLRSYNQEAALVMKAMLSLAEAKQRDTQDLVSEPISAQSIVIRLGDQAKKLKTCFPTKTSNGQFNLKLKNTGDLAAEVLSIISKQDDFGTSSTSVFVNGSLDKLLSQMNPIAMVSEKKGNSTTLGGSGSGGMREFKIEYGKYSVELRKALVTRIVRETLGIEAARVVRILLNKGRLDEKHLAKFAMMTLKDSRELCLKLSTQNIIELQEIPKTQDRMPSRTYYLYFIDFKKLNLNLINKLRKSQINCIERIYKELNSNRNLISKINRKDIFNDLNQFLNHWELIEFNRLKIKLQALEVAKIRLERDLFILRDLPWVG